MTRARPATADTVPATTPVEPDAAAGVGEGLRTGAEDKGFAVEEDEGVAVAAGVEPDGGRIG